jgi:hypothetical protein
MCGNGKMLAGRAAVGIDTGRAERRELGKSVGLGIAVKLKLALGSAAIEGGALSKSDFSSATAKRAAVSSTTFYY